MNRDDGNDDVLDQVRQALEELDLGSSATRDALVEGVREALGSVQEAFRDPDGRRTPEGKPDLRVVPRDDEDEDAPSVTVRWVNSRPTPAPEPDDDWLGLIAVPGGPETEVDAWQTVSHAPDPRPYRIRATSGTLEVFADGAPIARIAPGQTADVEACSIRVRGLGGPAHGTYDRL